MMLFKKKIPGFNELTVFVKDFCLKQLSSSYKDESYHIGNNGGKILSERESLFMVKTSEFDDERIKLIKKETDGDYPYKIVIETNGDYTSNFEIGLMLDDLEEHLPSKMIDDLDKEFYKFAEHYTDKE